MNPPQARSLALWEPSEIENAAMLAAGLGGVNPRLPLLRRVSDGHLMAAAHERRLEQPRLGLGAHEHALRRIAADVQAQRAIAGPLLIEQRGRSELLHEAPQLARAGRTLLEIDEVHADAALGEEALGLAGVLAVEEAEDLDCCRGARLHG